MASTKKVNILLSLKDKFSKPLAGTTKEIRKARQEMKLGQNQINKWGRSINNAFTGAVKNAAKFTAAMAAAGAGLGFKEAFSLETYKAQLETATGSTEKAAELMKNAIAMANKTPFEGGELVEATAMLEAMGMDSKKWLTYAGNMAGATGKDIMQATEAIIDAQAGEWERMKEFGIKGVDNMDDLVQIMNQRFTGGMEKLAGTTKGIWSTVTGVTKNSLAKIVGIMDDGSVRQGSALDKVKTKLSEFADTLTRWQNDGTIEAAAEKASAAVDKISNAFKWAKDNAGWLIPVLGGLVGALVAFNVLSTVIGLWKSYQTVATAVKAAQTALNLTMTMNPIGLLIVGIGLLIAAGVALAMHWDEVKAVAASLWENIKSVFGGIRDAVVGAFDTVKTKAGEALDWIGNKLDELWQKVQNIPVIGSLAKGAASSVSWLWDKMTAPGAAPPSYATGTPYFRGGISRINEGGRGELVQLPSGTKVFPHTKTKQMMGNKVYNINVNVNGGSDPDETGRIIAKRIKEALDVA